MADSLNTFWKIRRYTWTPKYLLAKELHAIALIDDEESHKMADLEEIPNHGTIYLLFCFLSKAIITKKEFIDQLNETIKEGWRCSTELYTKIIKALDSF
jgi:predicted nucleic acid-binding protein